jgi:hypothetical protein
MSSVVEAFKWGTLGEGSFSQGSATVSLTLIVLTMVMGLWFFNREETASVDKL